jgi:hypothetical protein
VELDHGDVVELEDTLTRYRWVLGEDHSLETAPESLTPLHQQGREAFSVSGRSDRDDILDLWTLFPSCQYHT